MRRSGAFAQLGKYTAPNNRGRWNASESSSHGSAWVGLQVVKETLTYFRSVRKLSSSAALGPAPECGAARCALSRPVGESLSASRTTESNQQVERDQTIRGKPRTPCRACAI